MMMNWLGVSIFSPFFFFDKLFSVLFILLNSL